MDPILNKQKLEVGGMPSPTKEIITDPVKKYRNFVRPKLTDMLGCLKLDIPYTKAGGNYLNYNKVTSDGIKDTLVLDFVGGFGANVMGHNNTELKMTLIDALNNDLPNLSQSSVRVKAAELAEKLNNIVPASGRYICNFSNSGTESVEAAMKHAFKIRTDAIQRKFDSISTRLNTIESHISTEAPNILLPENKNITQIIEEIKGQNTDELKDYLEHPIICAFKSAFHGKTTSSLKVTFNKTFRESYEGMSALRAHFLDIDKPEQLIDAANANMLVLKYLEIENNSIVIKTWETPKIFAFIFEVILGEGGILILSDKVLAELAVIHERLDIPFILDEIQTGCGRTGTFFAYEQTALRAIEPEYITLSKALGGGLCKIGVTMIHENVYDPEFGLVHTSTFAEDDMSSAVGLKVIEMLTRDDNKLMREAISKGEMIINKLENLKDKYPDIIKEVRGRGLMIGIEFTELNNYGPFFRYAGSQGFIALLMASYILYYHNIRILSPLTTMFKGNPDKRRRPVIRIQPSMYVTEQEIDMLINALDEVLNVISHNNEFVLLAHLMNVDVPHELISNPDKIPITYPAQKARTDIHGRIGFIVHITELKYLLDYYLPSFANYEYKRRDLIKWWDRLCRFLDPDLMHRTYVNSNNKTIEANLVCVPYLPKYMIKTYAEAQNTVEGDRENKILLLDMQDKIQDAVIKARDLGDDKIPVKIVGLGAYNSIVTENSFALNDNEVAVTTGNAFTTALVYLGILEAAKVRNLNLETATAAVVGASGNIGKALTCLVGAEVNKIFIIGRDKVQSYDKLARTRNLCLSRILENIRVQFNAGILIEEVKLKGFGFKIYNDIIKPGLLKEQSYNEKYSVLFHEIYGKKPISSSTGLLFDSLIREFYQVNENPFIEIANLDKLVECDIVAISTNSSDAWLISPNNTKKGSIICCTSVPSNLSESFKDSRDDYFVFDGGYALLPENSEIDFVGMPKHGNVYGCLAETMLMGFDGKDKSFARGEITLLQILKTIELAEKYGFKLGKFLLGDDIHRMVS